MDVKSALSGKVVELPIREGDVVKKGQLLAAIEPDVNQAQTLAGVRRGVNQAEIDFSDAEKDYLAKQELLKAGLISEEVHRAAETRYKSAREALAAAREKAAIIASSGIPLTTNRRPAHQHHLADGRRRDHAAPVELGEAVTGAGSFNAGTVIVTVADLSTMIVKAGVNEVDIGKVRLGAPVTVTLDAYPKVRFPGKVSRIAPAARLAGPGQGVRRRGHARHPGQGAAHRHDRQRHDQGRQGRPRCSRCPSSRSSTARTARSST